MFRQGPSRIAAERMDGDAFLMRVLHERFIGLFRQIPVDLQVNQINAFVAGKL